MNTNTATRNRADIYNQNLDFVQHYATLFSVERSEVLNAMLDYLKRQENGEYVDGLEPFLKRKFGNLLFN